VHEVGGAAQAEDCYVHRVAYYETDRMGIVHHSNYVRWMEEARVWYLDRIGHGFAAMEAAGITSPVLDVRCTYRRPTTFDDLVEVRVRPLQIGAARLRLAYEMRNRADGRVACTGETEHCFVGLEGRPLRIEREMPDFYAALVACSG
jgi:acyl-CoA thioester hydrolase